MANPIGASQFKVNDSFFEKLNKKVKVIAQQEAQQMAIDMHFILKRRFPLKGGNGRWPKSDRKSDIKIGGHSHNSWRIQKRPDNQYWVANYHEAVGGFNYTSILSTGKGWNSNVLNGHWKKLVTGTKVNGVFSTQMPNGLAPWLEIKRGDMEENIMKRIKKEL